MKDCYSPLKVFHHRDRIDALRAGKHPPPVHVHLVPTNRCNHNCAFCFTKDTIVDTIKGGIPISDVEVGDLVLDLDGGVSRVTGTSKRRADATVEIQASSIRVRCSKEHPFLTTNGFKEAGKIRPGDTAIVCVRLRRVCETTEKDLELVHRDTPTKDGNECGRQETNKRKDEETQPNEESSDCCEGRCSTTRSSKEPLSASIGQYIECSEEADAHRQSDEEEGSVQSFGGWPHNTDGKDNEEVVLQTSRFIRSGRNGVFGEPVDLLRLHGRRYEQSNRSRYSQQQGQSILQESNSEVCSGRMGVSCNSGERFEWTSKRDFAIGETFHHGGWEWCLEERVVDRVQQIDGSVSVFNFSCSPSETYIANGFAVHNCAYRAKDYSSSQEFRAVDQIPHDRLLNLPTELKDAGVQGVELTGGGEPTVHSGFSALCAALSSHGLDYGVVTNGSRLTDSNLLALSRTKWARFSIDAGTKETYSNIRRVKPQIYEKVRASIRDLIQQKLCRGNPVVGVGFVVTKDNWSELFQAAQNARDDGADNVRISAVFQDEGAEYFRKFYTGIRNLCRKAKALENDTFKVFDLFGDRVDDLQKQSPDYSYCGVQRLVCYIGADLNVYRCCVLAYNKHGLLGSIKDRTFGEFWNDPETVAKLDEFDARDCVRCMFNAKNNTIAYAINPNPSHVNFL